MQRHTSEDRVQYLAGVRWLDPTKVLPLERSTAELSRAVSTFSTTATARCSGSGCSTSSISDHVDDDWNARGLTEEGPGWQQEIGLTAADLELMQREYTPLPIQPRRSSRTHDVPFYNDRLCDLSSQTAPNRSQTDPKSECTQWHRRFCTPAAPLAEIAGPTPTLASTAGTLAPRSGCATAACCGRSLSPAFSGSEMAIACAVLQ